MNIDISGIQISIPDKETGELYQLKVGDSVKVLIKKYGDQYASYPGVIVGFDHFKNLPTLVITYLDAQYGSAEIQTVYFNSQSKDIELVKASEGDFSFSQEEIMKIFDRKIEEGEKNLRELEAKKAYFTEHFNNSFGGYEVLDKLKE